jgi:hypothetical protein
MSTTLIAFLFALLALTSAARADEYANRARAAQEQAASRHRAEVAARSYQINLFEINKLNNFVAQHGGLVEEGSCNVRVSTCREGDESPCPFRRDAAVAFSSLNPAADYYIGSCTLNLRDGLACRVYESFAWGTTNSTWAADCYDTNGQSRQIALGAGFGSTGNKAAGARKVIRKKRGK